MSLYVIADLHLATADSGKSMEIFGKRWNNYMNRLTDNWRRVVSDEDTVIIPGDISWALTINDALSDLLLIDSLPGKKIVMKGNHDFWWSTATKIKAFFNENNISSIEILNNGAIELEDVIVAGSRGWFTDISMQNAEENVDYNKIVNREAIRLDISLSQGDALRRSSGKEMIAFLHFPPVWSEFVCTPIFDVLKKHNISRCYFGHIHGCYAQPDAFEFNGIRFYMISADYLDFMPRIV